MIYCKYYNGKINVQSILISVSHLRCYVSLCIERFMCDQIHGYIKECQIISASFKVKYDNLNINIAAKNICYVKI